MMAAGIFLVVALTAFIVYQGSIHNEFVWDDPIVLGQQLQAFHSVSDIFFPPPRIPQFGGLYYRPMILVSYMTDRAVLGDAPWAFHLPVVLMHAVNSGLVSLLGLALFGSIASAGRKGLDAPGGGALLAALGGGLLFATHPIHTESVCWMAGRSDTLAALFLLPSLLCYLRWKRDRSGWLWLALSAALFLFACFSKETAAGFLLIVFAADLLRIGDPAKTAPSDRERARVAAAEAVAAGGGGRGGGKRKAGKDARGEVPGPLARPHPPPPRSPGRDGRLSAPPSSRTSSCASRR